jgi:hypothetical protein
MRTILEALGTADMALRNVAYALIGLAAYVGFRSRGSTPMSGAPAKARA